MSEAIPWDDLWKVLENFSAFVLYKLLFAKTEFEAVPDPQAVSILQDQLAVRNLGQWFEISRDMIVVLRGEPSLSLSRHAVTTLAKRLQTTSAEMMKAECKEHIPSMHDVTAAKLACPIAWLLTDKGCTDSKESEQVFAWVKGCGSGVFLASVFG